MPDTLFPADVTVTCRCGHTAALEAFTAAPITGELPAGHYQCPRCLAAWRVDHREREARFDSRFLGVQFAPSTIVPIPSVL